MSARLRRRRDFGNLKRKGQLNKANSASQVAHRNSYFLGVVTDRRLRPRARRRPITLRPPLVFIRARNPCVRLRLLLCGWYVRFTTILSALPRQIGMSADRYPSLCTVSS